MDVYEGCSWKLRFNLLKESHLQREHLSTTSEALVQASCMLNKFAQMLYSSMRVTLNYIRIMPMTSTDSSGCP